jgi:hypothetical protein
MQRLVPFCFRAARPDWVRASLPSVNHGHTKLLDPDHIRGDQAIPKARRDTFFNTLLEKVAKELSGSDYHLARILKYSGDLTRQKKKSAIEGAWVAFAPYHTRARQRGPDFFMAYDEGAAFCAASSIYV